jgi:drug/metabolite transporter (DMT)-like permease
MFLFWFSIGLTVLSNVVYHLAQKLTPAQANPMLSLAVTYMLAVVGSLLLLPLFPMQGGLAASLRQLNWSAAALAVAVIGLELGFLLAYRAGWNISLAGFLSNATVGVILIPVGLLLFREKINLVNVLGVVVCIAGLIMINRK